MLAATTPLPTPDASGLIAMSGTAGKVALLNTTVTIVSSACAEGPTVVEWSATAPPPTVAKSHRPRPCPIRPPQPAPTPAPTPTTTRLTSRPAPRRPQNTASPLDPCGGGDEPVAVTCGATLSAVEGASTVTRQITASDPDDIVDDIALTSVTPANAEITLGATTPAAADGGTASATLSVGTSNPGTYQVVITASNDDATNPAVGDVHGQRRDRVGPRDRRDPGAGLGHRERPDPSLAVRSRVGERPRPDGRDPRRHRPARPLAHGHGGQELRILPPGARRRDGRGCDDLGRHLRVHEHIPDAHRWLRAESSVTR